ncbi:hypothetical protein E4T52_02781 [Aureobasidium sp. EXF-3400]|nr:hypothetical protein E4T51_01242 [Aureobasidium sp. EXF-12344]KAI4782267.1 hypothetical protein E4T52_02781 [Aureobasidium sp. EXF-3400]
MESTNVYNKRIWRWWVVSDIISKSHDMIEIKSQKDDSGSVFSVAVHKELLCFYSPYYTAAIKGAFSESRQESFTVELDHRQTQMFVEWLYTGRCDSDPWQQINNHEVHSLYVFADQTDIIAFRRSIMTCLVRGGRVPPTPSDMAKLVSQLPNDSGLRLFLLEEAVAEWRVGANRRAMTEEEWKSRGYVREDFPEEFWDKLVYGQHGPYLPSCIACDYHEHTDEQEWKMSKKSGQTL